MTSWQDRREADRLDEAIEAMLRGEARGDARGGAGGQAPSPGSTSAPLAATVGTLLSAREDLHSEVAPSGAFSSSLRIQLVAEAERLADQARTAPAAAPANLALARRSRSRTSARRPRLLAGLVAGAVLAGTGAAAAVGAQTALPGEALYPVKRGMEALAVVGDEPAEAGRERLDQASTRLAEAAELIARNQPGDAALASEVIAEFAARATEGGSTLLGAEADGEDGSAEEVRAFTRDARDQLISLSQTTDTDVFAALVTAASTVYALDSQVDALCPTCGGAAEPLAPFAQAAEEAGRVLRGLAGVEVLPTETPRQAAERIAGETPQQKAPRQRTRGGQARQGGQGGDDSQPRGGTRTQQPGTTSPIAPGLPSPTIKLPTVELPGELTEAPVVGSTLKEVEKVVEESIVREVEDQLGRKVGQLGEIGDGLLGEKGVGGLLP